MNNRTKPIKILIVDDDQGIRGMIEDGLSIGKYEYQIKSGWDGKSGLDVMSDWKPDVLILDLHMPNGDGFDVTEAIKANPELKDTKIIMLTANPSKLNKFTGLDVGVDVFMAKPFDFEELEAAIRGVLDL